MRALVRKRTQQADRRTRLSRHPLHQLIQNPCTRSLRSCAATPLIPLSIKRWRLGQAVLAQSSELPTKIRETLEEEGRNPIHLAAGGPTKSWANQRVPSGSLRKDPSEMLQRARSSGDLRRQTDTTRLVRWRGEYGDPTSRR